MTLDAICCGNPTARSLVYPLNAVKGEPVPNSLKLRAIALLVVVVGLTACAGSSGSNSDTSVGAASRPGNTGGRTDQVLSHGVVNAPVAGLDAASGGGSVGAATAGYSSSIPEIGPRVIKNADISIRIDRGHIQDAVDSVTSTARVHRGFVVSTDVGGTDARGGSVTLRVPASEFESTLSRLEQLGHVTRQSVSGHDVSQEFVDLQARLKNATAQEEVLLRLMDRAQTIEDTIRVQQQLEGVELTIERLKGRIRYLDNETSFSTITVALVEAGAAPTRPASTLARAWAHAKDVALSVVSGVVVTAGFVIPVAFLLGVALLIYRLLRPRLRFGGSA